MKPLVRWTIGPTKPDGLKSLRISIERLKQLYDFDGIICYNNIDPELLSGMGVALKNQVVDLQGSPKGVAWKLYPPRLDISRHELFLDNDLIIEKRFDELDRFFEGDMTLLLEGVGRHYGRFERHVPDNYKINSGLFGVPPGFDLGKFLAFYGTDWEKNSNDSSFTFDEQGMVAISLLSYSRFCIISNKIVVNCEHELTESLGFHFIGLNRSKFHAPFREYCCRDVKIHL